jgi:hypothetical protein
MSLKISVTPDYSDIFDGEAPALTDMLWDIPSVNVLEVLALVNAQINNNPHRHTTQIAIFGLFISGQSDEYKTMFSNKIMLFLSRKKSDQADFFSKHFTLEFIHSELLNFRSGEKIVLSVDQLLRILKAYFIICESVNLNFSEAFNAHSKLSDDYFRTRTWPTLLEQFTLNHTEHPMTYLVKGAVLLNYFTKEIVHERYVNNFLEHYEKSDVIHYLMHLIEIQKVSWTTQDGGYPYELLESDGYKNILNDFSLDIDEYRSLYTTNKASFTGIKSKPIFKAGKTFIVLDWNLFSQKMYAGLLFDFYKHSGISEVRKFGKFIDFKNHVSEHVIEQFLFKRLFNEIFIKKHCPLNFSEKGGYPDCYFRKGNIVYLFELKDAFFSAAATGSYSYVSIKKTIDDKYNNKKKGTGQIIKQLQHLTENTFEEKSFEELNIKPRNLIIYPVIIYTDSHFDLPGINNYLCEEFELALKENALTSSFKSIRRLTFINLSFFIDLLPNLKKVDFRDLLDTYSKVILNRTRSFKNNTTIERLFSMNDIFASVISKEFSEQFYRDDNYVELIFKTLELLNDNV